jgi:hypothetical protein
MRLNEFQAHVVRGEQITGIIDTEIAAAIERSVADMLVAAARLAQAAGTDLDSIAYAAVQKLPVASVPTGNISEKQES